VTKKTIKPKKMLAGGIIKAAVKAGGKAVQAANSPQPPAARGRGLSRAIGSAVNLAGKAAQPPAARGRGLSRAIGSAVNKVGSAVNKAQEVAVEKAKGGSVTKKPKKKV